MKNPLRKPGPKLCHALSGYEKAQLRSTSCRAMEVVFHIGGSHKPPHSYTTCLPLSTHTVTGRKKIQFCNGLLFAQPLWVKITFKNIHFKGICGLLCDFFFLPHAHLYNT